MTDNNHQTTDAGRSPASGAWDPTEALRLILDALEGPTGELGEVSAVSVIRSGDQATVTALVRSRERSSTRVRRAVVAPDWTRGGRLAIKWGATSEIVSPA